MQRFQVSIASFSGDDVPLIAALRTIGRVGLADAVAVLSYVHATARTVVVAGVERSVAEHVAATLREVGAEVAVAPSALDTPMVCRPQAHQAYRRDAGGRLVKTVARGEPSA